MRNNQQLQDSAQAYRNTMRAINLSGFDAYAHPKGIKIKDPQTNLVLFTGTIWQCENWSEEYLAGGSIRNPFPTITMCYAIASIIFFLGSFILENRIVYFTIGTIGTALLALAYLNVYFAYKFQKRFN